MTVQDNLALASEEFASRLSAVSDGDWDKATPCDGWSVRELVNHVIAGNVMAAKLLDGASKEDASAAFDTDHTEGDVAAAYAASAAAQAGGFAADGSLDKVVHHPAMDMPGAQLVGFRTVDLGVHAWDLAKAIDGDQALGDDVSQAMWDVVSPLAPFIGQIGMFGTGPSGDVADDAPLQQRVLDMVGRRP